MRARMVLWSTVFAFAIPHAGCSSAKSTCSGTCTDSANVGGKDGSPTDDNDGSAASPDANGPAERDGSAALADAAPSTSDGGVAGSDAGCCDQKPAGPGPWPTADLTVYSIGEDIVDSSPDDAQNLWAISRTGLYLRRPGEASFRKFTAADGLHITPFTDANGQSNQTSPTAMAGGRGNEVYVGYYGYETNGDPFMDTQAQKELGNADRVTVDANGTLTVTRYLFRCDYSPGSGCWEDRSPRHMIYAHEGIAAGHLFIGFNHGVSHVFNDQMGDHVHPEVWYHYADGHVTEKIGEFFGLALTTDGDLWMAGRYGAGLQPWNPTPHFAWVDGHMKYAFTVQNPGHSLDVPADYREDNSAVAITPNGTTYFASFTNGLWAWPHAGPNYGTIQQVMNPALPSQIMDMTADLDGTLWLIDGDGRLLRLDPASGIVSVFAGVSSARRIVIDRTVTPRALYVSMSGGLAVIRAK